MSQWRERFPESDTWFWPSFVDLMAVILLVLLIVLVGAFVQAADEARHRVANGLAIEEMARIIQRREAVSAQLKAILGGDAEQQPDGNFMLKEELLFEKDTSTLRTNPTPDAFLQRLADGLVDLLEQPDIQKSLLVILVEGHTADPPDDPKGLNDWDLSAERARMIVERLQELNPKLKEKPYARYLGVVGRADYNEIDPGKGEKSLEKNRRVEIRIVLRDDELKKAVDSARPNR